MPHQRCTACHRIARCCRHIGSVPTLPPASLLQISSQLTPLPETLPFSLPPSLPSSHLPPLPSAPPALPVRRVCEDWLAGVRPLLLQAAALANLHHHTVQVRSPALFCTLSS